MNENKKQAHHRRILDNRNTDISIIGLLYFSVFSFLFLDLFQSSKAFNEKLLIRFANIRV